MPRRKPAPQPPPEPFGPEAEHTWHGDPHDLQVALDLIDKFRTTKRSYTQPVILLGDKRAGKSTALRHLHNYATTPSTSSRSRTQAVTFINYNPDPSAEDPQDLQTTLRDAIKPHYTPGRRFKRLLYPLADYLVLAASLAAKAAGLGASPITTRFFRNRLTGITLKESLDAAITGAHKNNGTGLIIGIDNAQDAHPEDLRKILGYIEHRKKTDPTIGLILTLEPNNLQAFHERYHQHSGHHHTLTLPRLTPEHAHNLLTHPTPDHHIHWEPTALETIINTADGHPEVLHHLAQKAHDQTYRGISITKESAEKSLSSIVLLTALRAKKPIEELSPETRFYLSAVLACADKTGQALRDDIRSHLKPDFHIGEAVEELCANGYLRRGHETVQLLPPRKVLSEVLPPVASRYSAPHPQFGKIFAAMAPAKAILVNQTRPAPPGYLPPGTDQALPPPVIHRSTPDYGR